MAIMAIFTTMCNTVECYKLITNKLRNMQEYAIDTGITELVEFSP